MPGHQWSLRVSVLEQCQLRCGYCLPTSAVLAGKKSWLNIAQYDRVARLFSRLLVKKIRFTGGEPLLRQDLSEIIARFAEHCPQSLLALTTNGLAFAPVGLKLKNAGLTSITFHLDTLKAERYRAIMGSCGDLSVVLANIRLACELGFKLKINTVVQRDLNSDELIDFLSWSHGLGIQLRFIELMNTGSAGNFIKRHFMSGQEILEHIDSVKSLGRIDKSDPAELFSWHNTSFGLIASDTRPFCDHCNRLRLSASGKLYTCLYDPTGADLGFLSNESEEENFQRMKLKIASKTSFHPDFKKPRRLFSMAQTGG